VDFASDTYGALHHAVNNAGIGDAQGAGRRDRPGRLEFITGPYYLVAGGYTPYETLAGAAGDVGSLNANDLTPPAQVV
jgi:hypothetical protein